MLVHPDERIPLARLLQFLAHGERLAHDCARAQAALAPDARMRGFLSGQARQEALHAAVFRGAVAWLAPRHLGKCPVLLPLERYRTLLEEAILKRLEAGLVKRKAGFSRLRCILLHQEEAHHGFGCHVLERAMATGRTSSDALQLRALEYLTLTDAMVATLSELFVSIDEDPSAYASDAKRSLPAWLAR